MNQQRFMDLLACHGHALLSVIVGDDSDSSDSDEDIDEKTLLFRFVKKKFMEIGKPKIAPTLNRFLKPDPLIPIPPELYRRSLDREKRRQLFFKHLNRRDILYLQVLNCEGKDSYKCLALAKHGDLMKLDDLSIIVHFPKLSPELELLKGDLFKFDLLRGALWSCCVWSRRFFVTLDTQIFTEQEKEKIPKFGKITRKDLPDQVGCLKIGMTYAGYVQRSKGYKDEDFVLKQLQQSLGINTNRIYSFLNKWNGKQYPESESYEELAKNLTPNPSNAKLYKSYEYFRDNNMYKALQYANKAIMLNPDNVDARVARGAVYANLGKMKKAFIDTEDSLKLDAGHEAAKKQMSELLVSASKEHLIQRDFLKWHELLVLARTYYCNNHEAEELLTKARFETVASTSFNGAPTRMIIQPLWSDVAHIYKRIMTNQKRLLRKFKKARKRKRKHAKRTKRRRAVRHKPQPIPCISTSRKRRSIPSTSTSRKRQSIPSTSTSRSPPNHYTGTSRSLPNPYTGAARSPPNPYTSIARSQPMAYTIPLFNTGICHLIPSTSTARSPPSPSFGITRSHPIPSTSSVRSPPSQSFGTTRSYPIPSTSSARSPPSPSFGTTRNEPFLSTSTSRSKPIPTTSTSRRQVFLKPGSPVFRKPFPPSPSSTIPRPP